MFAKRHQSGHVIKAFLLCLSLSIYVPISACEETQDTPTQDWIDLSANRMGYSFNPNHVCTGYEPSDCDLWLDQPEYYKYRLTSPLGSKFVRVGTHEDPNDYENIDIGNTEIPNYNSWTDGYAAIGKEDENAVFATLALSRNPDHSADEAPLVLLKVIMVDPVAQVTFYYKFVER